MALFIAVLLAVAAIAALAVRGLLEQDARQSASDDSGFAAPRAAKQVEAGLEQIRSLSVPLAANPGLASVYADPSKCSIGYAPISPFSTGHIDLVRLDGSIVCSSSKLTSVVAAPYAGQAWLEATQPVVVAPTLDPVTGKQVAIVSYPVAGEGAFVWFLDLDPVGPGLESAFGSGVHQLEFLITANAGHSIVARSINPGKWVGASTIGNAFAGASSPGTRSDVDGTRRIYGDSAIAPEGWVLYVGADEAGSLAAADQLSNRLLAIILAGMAIMLVVVFLVYHRIAEPVRRLSLVMRGSTPRAAVKALAGTGAAELTALAEDFDQLMETINRELAERL